MKSGLSRLRAIFIIMASLLVCGVVINYLAGLAALRFREKVSAHDAVIGLLQETLSTMQDAETGQRGYLLSRDEKYLEPYFSASADIRKKVAGLEGLVEDGRLPAAQTKEIVAEINQKLAELSQTVDLVRDGKATAAIPVFREGQGRRLMDSIRDRIGALKLEEERLRLQADERTDKITLLRTATFVVVAAINLGFLLWAFIRIRRHLSDQYVATLETQRQKDILTVTLASIGDAVIITDTHARITFLNKIAEELTGWSSSEAIDKPSAEVFRIINEDTRQPVESPVDKVLAHGRIVGLANHTLLIRKDGSEVSIDDSGAPIRESDGTIRGVVLVFRDFTAHKESEQILIGAKTEIELASKAKDKFLATLSHELRTPLTPILATISSMEEAADTPPRFRSDLQLIRRNVELEARIIDDLLDLTRIEHGKLLLEKQPVDVHAEIDSVAALFRKDCLTHNIRLSVSHGASRYFVDADPARLHQILWNLVGNAVKFSRDKGHIEIATADTPDGRLSITVTDNGVGMSPDTLSRIFHRFEQGDLSAPRYSQGLGLGLSISKALVENHGGTLTASSEGEGKGSQFVCILPVIDAPALPVKIAHTDTHDARSLRILVLEDHEDTGTVLRMVLQGMGHSVDLSTTIASALLLAKAHTYGLILSDLGLPDGSGLEFIQELRKTDTTPAIALTGYGMAEDVEKCLQAGFTEHLTKPIDFEKLRSHIEKVANP